MKSNAALGLSLALFALSCKGPQPNAFQLDEQSATYAIEKDILTNDSSFYYIDAKNYFAGVNISELPIGVFDSGTGGLTVLDALVRYDNNNNATKASGADQQADFAQENFIYLGDQANMPYGNYFKTGKTDLLKEHVVKDIQFLLGNKYYSDGAATQAHSDKQKVKAIVIACNTATAYGQAEADAFMARTGLKVPVIGVINAGTRGLLQQFAKNESASVGVFATVGTIASNGYGKNIEQMAKQLGYTGQLQVFNQGGHGVAEAVDEEPDFINKKLTSPRKDYRGPALGDADFAIDKTLLNVYNFKYDHGKMLCDGKNGSDCNVLQINDTENYVRYHLVSLMEQIRKADQPQPLKALVLGCTHYPYLVKEIKNVLAELYNYQGNDKAYVYRALMAKEVKLIDPAEYVAKELFDALKTQDSFNSKGNYLTQSEFYISVPNSKNAKAQLDEEGRFTYDYKYGRNAGELQEYVKVVPFNKSNLSGATLDRFKSAIPTTYTMMKAFNQGNAKLQGLPAAQKIN